MSRILFSFQTLSHSYFFRIHHLPHSSLMNTPPYSQFDHHDEESDVSPLLSLNPIDTPPYSPLDLEDDDSIWDNDEDTLLLAPCIDLDHVSSNNNNPSTSTSDIVNGQLRSNLAGLGITAPPSPPLQPAKVLMCDDDEQHQVLDQELCMESAIASPSAQSDFQQQQHHSISLWSDEHIHDPRICHDLSIAHNTIEPHQHLESLPSADLHAPKKLFSCTSCDKRFRRAHDVARHISKVHYDH